MLAGSSATHRLPTVFGRGVLVLGVAGVALVVLGDEWLTHAGRADVTALEHQRELAALWAPVTDRRDLWPYQWLANRELHDDSPCIRTILLRLSRQNMA